MDSKKIKRDFPIFQNRQELTYLDNAATSQKPEKVINAIERFYRENNSNEGRGLYNLAANATNEYKESRKKIAEFIGASKDEIIFVRNTTEAENLLADTLEFEGDVVLSEMAHHSEQLPWRRKAEKEDKNVKYIDTEKGVISLESAKDEITEETGLVAISHISNVFGAENPVRQIAELAHERNALVVVDAAQSAPHSPLDVKKLEADFLAFSGHKMLGPTGIGVLYAKKSLMSDMRGYQLGGGMVDSVEQDEVSYTKGPERFEAGTPNIAGAVGLAAAVEYLEEIGLEEISKHNQKLVRKMIEGLKNIEGVNVISPEEANLVSFTAEWAHPHDIAEVLNQHKIAVRAGHHCAQPQMKKLDTSGTTRASPYLYNTEQDVEKLVEAVEEARKLFT